MIAKSWAIPGLIFMDTIPRNRSQISVTGHSDYVTGHRPCNNLWPVIDCKNVSVFYQNQHFWCWFQRKKSDFDIIWDQSPDISWINKSTTPENQNLLHSETNIFTYSHNITNKCAICQPRTANFIEKYQYKCNLRPVPPQLRNK